MSNPFSLTRPIAVLLGGESTEREVSLASGRTVVKALVRAGYLTYPIDPLHSAVEEVDWQRFDVCFIALHGGAGEDGRMQHFLASHQVPFTGSGPKACRLAMSKSAAKNRWQEAGVPTPPFLLLDVSQPTVSGRASLDGWQFPIVIKPDDQGSSLGVKIAHRAEELATCLYASGQFSTSILAEAYIPGREFTVAILNRQPLPVLEVRHNTLIFTYADKYDQFQSCYRLATDLDLRQRTRLQATAVAAATAIGTQGLVRVDLIQPLSGPPQVLELNTVPGMAATSAAPLAATHFGLDMPTLCTRLIRECWTGDIPDQQSDQMTAGPAA